MDLFTHVLFAYLVSFGLWGPNGLQYIAAGALAGGLPDADALFFPLAGRFPLLRHHGITHSIFGVTLVAAVGAFVVPILFTAVVGAGFAAGSTLLYFLAMEAGGLCHVFLDGFTHFSVPPFAPFSKYEFHLDADRAINVGTMAFTGFSFWLMIYERGRVPVWFWEATAWALLAVYLGYLVVRLAARWRAEVARRTGGFSAVVPQGNPFVFLLVEEDLTGPRVRVRMESYHLFHGSLGVAQSLEVAKIPPEAGPVRSAQDAMERSYGPAIQQGRMLGLTYHFAKVRESPGQYDVFWYSLEFSLLGRAAGVLARVDAATGTVETKSSWMSPLRFAT
ncbi:MAG: metal-dependent hydrolase [Thermoplasmata archaeon]|nr:metal-dependent hydrolase [Thermoplasmata archaeon]